MYTTSLSFNLDDVFDYFVPEGYEIVEKNDHKKKRLELEIESLKSQKDYYSKQLPIFDKEIKEREKALKEIK